MKRFQVLAGFAAAASLAVTAPALAHTHLVRSNPQAGATVHTGPKTITLTFNERVVPAFSKFELSMPEHRMAVPIKTTVSADGKRIVGTLQYRLTPGAYKIAWTAAGSDGHKMTGEVAFKVG